MTINRLTKTAWYSLQNIYIYIKKKRNWNIHDTTITPKIYQSSKYLKQTCNSQFTIWQKKKKKISLAQFETFATSTISSTVLVNFANFAFYFFFSLPRSPDTRYREKEEGGKRASERTFKENGCNWRRWTAYGRNEACCQFSRAATVVSEGSNKLQARYVVSRSTDRLTGN